MEYIHDNTRASASIFYSAHKDHTVNKISTNSDAMIYADGHSIVSDLEGFKNLQKLVNEAIELLEGKDA